MPAQTSPAKIVESSIFVSPIAEDSLRTSEASAANAAAAGVTMEPIFVGAGSRRAQKPRRWLLPSLLGSALVAAIGIVMVIAYRGSQQQTALQATQTQSASFYGAINPISKVLASQYTDADGDLLADAPTDLAALVDPDTLVVAHYEGDYEEDPRVNWDAFKAHLEAATGKKIVLQEYLHTAVEVEAIAQGQIHIVAPHAADVPCLVNYAGLVPVAALGTDDAPNGNHMVIAVTPSSNLQSLKDLKGKTLTCTRPNSITGYRAAVTLMSQQANMRLDSDYHVFLSDGQGRSIRGLVARWFEVAAISHDKLQWALAKGTIKDSHYRTIYESEVIPRLTIGHIHNLTPQLAAKVTAAMLSFDNQRTNGEEWTTLPMRFHAVDYQRDFQFVRKMDNSFDPRCGRLALRSDR